MTDTTNTARVQAWTLHRAKLAVRDAAREHHTAIRNKIAEQNAKIAGADDHNAELIAAQIAFEIDDGPKPKAQPIDKHFEGQKLDALKAKQQEAREAEDAAQNHAESTLAQAREVDRQHGWNWVADNGVLDWRKVAGSYEDDKIRSLTLGQIADAVAAMNVVSRQNITVGELLDRVLEWNDKGAAIANARAKMCPLSETGKAFLDQSGALSLCY